MSHERRTYDAVVWDSINQTELDSESFQALTPSDASSAKLSAMKAARSFVEEFAEEYGVSVYVHVHYDNSNDPTDFLYIGPDGMEDTVAIDWMD